MDKWLKRFDGTETKGVCLHDMNLSTGSFFWCFQFLFEQNIVGLHKLFLCNKAVLF